VGRIQTAVLVSIVGILSLLSTTLYMKIKNESEVKSRSNMAEDSLQEELVIDTSPDSDAIKIGLILALTGVKSDSDIGTLEGAELAIERLNFEGGALGKKFKLVIFDNRGTPIGSKKAAEKALKLGVSGVVGPERSSYALATAPLFQAAGVPMIAHLSTHTDVTELGDYIFRACYTDEFQGDKLGSYAANELKAENAVVLRMLDEDYSLKLSEYFKESYERLGGRVEWTGNYKAKDMDYSGIIKNIKEIDPELVFIAGYTKDIGLIIRQADMMGADVKFLAGDGVGNRVYNFGGASVDGLSSTTHWHEGIDSEESRKLVERYKERYEKSMVESESVALAYDSVRLLGEAIRKGESLDGESIKTELFELSGFEGATGLYEFNENGDPLDKELVVVEFRGGKRELVKEYRSR
jgi:branched-chain amino acid transport system substrate-binding protein